jgi:hypothetical protein
LFFQPEQYFSLTTNQPTVFFSRLISTAERLNGLIAKVVYTKYYQVVVEENNITLRQSKQHTPLI